MYYSSSKSRSTTQLQQYSGSKVQLSAKIKISAASICQQMQPEMELQIFYKLQMHSYVEKK
jgi:hypothetical protein